MTKYEKAFQEAKRKLNFWGINKTVILFHPKDLDRPQKQQLVDSISKEFRKEIALKRWRFGLYKMHVRKIE